MSNLYFFLTFLFVSISFSAEYSIQTKYGERINNFIISVDGEKNFIIKVQKKKQVDLTREDSMYYKKVVAEIFEEKSNDQNLCPNNNIRISEARNESFRFGCIGSKTKVASQMQQLIRMIELSFKLPNK